jgi:solute carrier family 25 citrate transporter 1
VLLGVGKAEGIKGVYTGCSTLVVVSHQTNSDRHPINSHVKQGTALKAGVRFLTFDAIKNALSDDTGKLSAYRGILAGMAASCVESVVAVTPTERIKTAL